MYEAKLGKRYQFASPIKSIGGGAVRFPSTRGASDTPQFPATTVVTPWLAFAAISGAESIKRSSCVCASMNPGETIFPSARISVFAVAFESEPIAAIRPASTPISASKRGARVPSITVPLRRIRSNCTPMRLPSPEALPERGDFASAIHHVVALVLRARRAGVVGQDAQPRADRQVWRRAAAAPRDDAMLLVAFRHDQAGDRPSVEVADHAVPLVHALVRRASVARH